VAWNSLNWNNTLGGPIRFSYRHGGTPLPDYTGADEYPTVVDIVDKICECRITMRDVKQVLTLGTVSNLVVTLPTKSGSVALTFANMALVDISGSQSRSAYGEVELTFQYQCASGGTTAPLS
jgi:hypothetical protein